ncbi:hypothetical protein [Streptomyces fulvorobeus]|uniref:Uncharacterized protein n=1 Tax=Streptomyces fulvorobeus TaxID=284028 RepID=A0A7Y9H8M4_9ACTN|nr:hypothetical protein [Streptomyces fulvorobeus]NYE39907.1 hypothetical protein [Streptomyces fulvorobeus]
MQTSALPDLAHTATKPVHWLATATAMAAVVACAGLLQPGTATATASAASSRGGAPVAAPDAAAAAYPLDCGGAKNVVTHEAAGDLDGDGRPETVAVVRCDAGTGTPPSGVYVLTHGSGAAPTVVATLVDPARKLTVTDFSVRDGIVSATLLGYSSADVPRCCPDEQERAGWRWEGDAFVRSAQDPARGA